MNERQQRVKDPLTQNFSSWASVTSGVPQGSVIGHVLFVMVTNSLQCVDPERTVIVAYADDITFLHYVPPKSVDNLQIEADNLSEWAYKNYYI